MSDEMLTCAAADPATTAAAIREREMRFMSGCPGFWWMTKGVEIAEGESVSSISGRDGRSAVCRRGKEHVEVHRAAATADRGQIWRRQRSPRNIGECGLVMPPWGPRPPRRHHALTPPHGLTGTLCPTG